MNATLLAAAPGGDGGRNAMDSHKQESEGKRSRGGRPRQFGATARRDLRVPLHVERAAIKIGSGAFSDGMRYMVEQYLRTAPRLVEEEAPPQDEPVLIWLEDEGRWVIVVAAGGEGVVRFRDADKPDVLYSAPAWRRLPNVDDPMP